jgi:putative inorganic carbon (HCO3(-)) transporter
MISYIRTVTGKIATVEILTVVTLTGVSFIFPSFLGVTVIVAIFFWMVRKLATGHFTRRTPTDLSIIVLVLMGIVSMLLTTTPDITQVQVLRLYVGIAIYYSVVNWTSNLSKLKIISFAVVLVAFVFALIGLFSISWNTAKIPFIPAAIYQSLPTLLADVSHRNVVAGYLVILLPFCISLLIFGWKEYSWLFRAAIGIPVMGVLLVTILSQSRGAWIALLLAISVLALFRWKSAWYIVIPFIILIPLGMYFWGSDQVLELLVTDETIQGIEGRTEIWSRAIYMIQDFPFTGIGMGSFCVVADRLYPFFLASPFTIPHAHNLFLQLAADLGLPGLIAWCATFMLIFFVSWLVYRHAQSRGETWIAGVAGGLLASLVALITHGMIDSVVWGMVRPTPTIWAIWGLAVASWYIQHSPEIGDQIETISSPIS